MLSLSLLVVAMATTKLHAADGSFVGKWKLNPEKNTMHDSEKTDPVEIEVKPYQDNGLTFINQTQYSTKDMKFDGKDCPVRDANSPADAMVFGAPRECHRSRIH